MKKLAVVLMMLAVVALLAPAAFATRSWSKRRIRAHRITPRLRLAWGMGLAAFGGAFGQGRVAAAACEGMARNPAAGGAIRAAMILDCVVRRDPILLTFVIAIVLYLKIVIRSSPRVFFSTTAPVTPERFFF